MHTKAGRLQSAGEPVTTTKDKLRRVVVPGQFVKRKLDVEIVFNAEGEIAGLLLHSK